MCPPVRHHTGRKGWRRPSVCSLSFPWAGKVTLPSAGLRGPGHRGVLGGRGWALTCSPRRPTCPGRRCLPRLQPRVQVPPCAARRARQAPAAPRPSCGGRTGRAAAASRGRPRRGRTRARPGRAGPREDASPGNYLGAPRSTQARASWGRRDAASLRWRCPKAPQPCQWSSQPDILSAPPLWGPLFLPQDPPGLC